MFRGNVIELSNYRVIFIDLGIFLALTKEHDILSRW